METGTTIAARVAAVEERPERDAAPLRRSDADLPGPWDGFDLARVAPGLAPGLANAAVVPLDELLIEIGGGASPGDDGGSDSDADTPGCLIWDIDSAGMSGGDGLLDG